MTENSGTVIRVAVYHIRGVGTLPMEVKLGRLPQSAIPSFDGTHNQIPREIFTHTRSSGRGTPERLIPVFRITRPSDGPDGLPTDRGSGDPFGPDTLDCGLAGDRPCQ